jgi:O-antigen ligase
MFLRKIVLALMALLVFSVPIAGGRLSFDVNIGSVGLMSIVGILAFLFAIAHLLFGHRGVGQAKVPMDRSVTLFGVFVALNFASVGWAQDSGVAIISSMDYLQILVLVWLLLFLRPEPKALTIIMHAFFMGSMFLVLNSLYDVLSLGLDAIGNQRIAGFGVHVNRLAFKLALGIPVAFYLWQRGIPSLRWIYLTYIPAAAFLVLLSGSRTGAATAIVGIVFGLWPILRVEEGGLARFSRKRLLISAGVAAVLVFTVVPTVYDRFQFHVERLASLVDPMSTEGVGAKDSGFGGRAHLWEALFQAYLDNVILGIGSGHSRTVMLDYMGHDALVVSLSPQELSPHSAYFLIASETGTIGLLLYLAVIVSLFLRIRSFPRQEQLLFLALMAVALVHGVAGSATTGREFNFALFVSVIFLVYRDGPARVRQTADRARPAQTLGTESRQV